MTRDPEISSVGFRAGNEALSEVRCGDFPLSFAELTGLERAFVLEYCAGGCSNATAAASGVIAAGFSKAKNASVLGSGLLKRERVLRAISDYQAKISREVSMDQREFVEILISIARGVPLGKALNDDGTANIDFLRSDEARRVIDGLSVSKNRASSEGNNISGDAVTLKTPDRIKAMGLLARVMGWDRGSDGSSSGKTITVNVNIPAFGSRADDGGERVIEMNEHPALKGGSDE